MLNFHSKILQKFVEKWPGEKYFGEYRFLPLFFILGAALEFSMINLRVGSVNFCKNSTLWFQYYFCIKLFILDDTYKRREAKELLEKEYSEHQTASSTF